jgi:hypothetical protein
MPKNFNDLYYENPESFGYTKGKKVFTLSAFVIIEQGSGYLQDENWDNESNPFNNEYEVFHGTAEEAEERRTRQEGSGRRFAVHPVTITMSYGAAMFQPKKKGEAKQSSTEDDEEFPMPTLEELLNEGN